MWVLRHLFVQIVLHHEHDASGLVAAGGVLANGSRPHLVVRAETVHINTTEGFEFGGKFGGQFGVPFRGEIAQGVLHGEHFFSIGQNAFDS